jgi:hypothetical protein
VWESVRERIGQNPCDKRRKVSEIRPQFPLFSFDRVQDDDDLLWGDVRESTEALLQRARTFLHALRQRPGMAQPPQHLNAQLPINLTAHTARARSHTQRLALVWCRTAPS